MEVKFKFVYSNGKDFIVKVFDLVEIMNGDPFEVLSDMPLYRDFKMVGEYQYIGRCINGTDIFIGDIISDHVGIGLVVWSQRNCAFKVSYRGANAGTGKWFSDYINREIRSVEVIGAIYKNPELLEDK